MFSIEGNTRLDSIATEVVRRISLPTSADGVVEAVIRKADLATLDSPPFIDGTAEARYALIAPAWR